MDKILLSYPMNLILSPQNSLANLGLTKIGLSKLKPNNALNWFNNVSKYDGEFIEH